MDLAEKLYDLREKRGLSQTAAAKLAGTTRAVIESIEESDYDPLRSRPILDRLAKAVASEGAASLTSTATAGSA
jgi:transcriptional regulator with XRE-family HTH domain